MTTRYWSRDLTIDLDSGTLKIVFQAITRAFMSDRIILKHSHRVLESVSAAHLTLQRGAHLGHNPAKLGSLFLQPLKALLPTYPQLGNLVL